jgi:enamine deaminase RidA (YjgF/YER057c/UK114 family)
MGPCKKPECGRSHRSRWSDLNEYGFEGRNLRWEWLSSCHCRAAVKTTWHQASTPPEPFGIYAEAVQTGNLLFLTGMLPTVGREAKFIGRVGAELDVETGREAAFLAAINALAVARQHLGSLDKVTRIVRLGVAVATSGDVREQPKIADGASELLQDVFGKSKSPSRLVYGVASLPLGTPVELELIFEVSA